MYQALSCPHPQPHRAESDSGFGTGLKTIKYGWMVSSLPWLKTYTCVRTMRPLDHTRLCQQNGYAPPMYHANSKSLTESGPLSAETSNSPVLT